MNEDTLFKELTALSFSTVYQIFFFCLEKNQISSNQIKEKQPNTHRISPNFESTKKKNGHLKQIPIQENSPKPAKRNQQIHKKFSSIAKSPDELESNADYEEVDYIKDEMQLDGGYVKLKQRKFW